MDYEDDFSAGSQTVTLHFGTKEVEMSVEQITTTSIALVFSLDAATVWLQDHIGSSIYIPDDEGRFEGLSRHSSNVHGVTVNGVNSQHGSTTPQPQNASTPNSSVTVSSVSTSALRPPFFHSVTSRKNVTRVKVKFVRSDVAYTGNGRSIFTNIDAMFVNLTDDNADVNSMKALVQSEYGPNFTIVGNDGLQIKNSPATRGMFFSHVHSKTC